MTPDELRTEDVNMDLELVDDPNPSTSSTTDATTANVPVDDGPSHLSYPTYEFGEPGSLERQEREWDVRERERDRAREREKEREKSVLKERLYIGNLHPSVDEYALLHVFSKFGKVTKLDFLFHKSGPLKGKPRGYAFVEYGVPEEAAKALSIAHGKLLRGRKLVVTFAHQAPLESYPGGSGGGISSKFRRPVMETGRPTTLSIIKTGLGGGRHEPKTADKIALMEAKLRQLEASHPASTSSNSLNTATTATTTTATAMTTKSSLPHHPSLPAKPPPPLPSHILDALHATSSSSTSRSNSGSGSSGGGMSGTNQRNATPRGGSLQSGIGMGNGPSPRTGMGMGIRAGTTPGQGGRQKTVLPSLPLSRPSSTGGGSGAVGVAGKLPGGLGGASGKAGMGTGATGGGAGVKLGKTKLAGVVIKPKKAKVQDKKVEGDVTGTKEKKEGDVTGMKDKDAEREGKAGVEKMNVDGSVEKKVE
ncbi:polyadenylate-binding protein [Coprinopsis cinerea AmutBmut pab1-1]|nr:polyadenylate-binding protein [Coprinopsis cinerea AmutBmut pab1-1]